MTENSRPPELARTFDLRPQDGGGQVRCRAGALWGCGGHREGIISHKSSYVYYCSGGLKRAHRGTMRVIIAPPGRAVKANRQKGCIAYTVRYISWLLDKGVMLWQL